MTKIVNVPNVFKNSFTTIERIWAENGVVKVLTKEGHQTTLTVRQAAQRAQALNNMQVPDWHKKRRNELVSKIIEVCREAKAQSEDPKDEKTKAITNVLAGKAADGTEIKETLDQKVQRYMFTYPTLSEREVGAIVISQDIDEKQKDMLMKEIHRQNMQEIAKEDDV